MQDSPPPSSNSQSSSQDYTNIEAEKLRLARDQFEHEKMASGKLTTAQITLFASLLSVASALFGASISGWFSTRVEQVKANNSINLEKAKFETDLVIKAINTDDQSKAIKTLKFFAKAGLIPTFESNVTKLTDDDNGNAIPALQATQDDGTLLEETAANLLLSRYVGYMYFKGSPACNVTFFDSKHIIVNAHCVGEAAEVADLDVTAGQLDIDRTSVYRGFIVSNMTDIISLKLEHVFSIKGTKMLLGTLDRPNPLLKGFTPNRTPHKTDSLRVIYISLSGNQRYYMSKNVGCKVVDTNPLISHDLFVGDFGYSCPTPNGSSGAPILSTEGGIIVGLVDGYEGPKLDYGMPIDDNKIRSMILAEEDNALK